jgi:thiol-disulfide isomerase/thioredoxin
MKKLLATVFLCSLALGQDAAPEPKKIDPEQQELNTALAEAGNSNVDFTRALENHLKKYPNSAQKTAIERALVKAAIEAKDDKRTIEYGERSLAVPPIDLQVMDQLLRALLRSDDKETAVKALGYAKKYQEEIERIGKLPPAGRLSETQWKEEIDKGLARAYVYQARATGNQDKFQDAVDLARKSWDTYPTATAAREMGRWLAKMGKNLEAVQLIADAFTIADPLVTETERGKDRIRMGELYQKATGGEKGLGDIILEAYDRTHALMSERAAKLKAADPNLQASKITDFTLEAVTGGKLPLSSLHGKTVVMDFWATWCGPCKVQHPLYEKVQQTFKNNPDVVFLAVSTDEDHSLVAPVLKERNWSDKNVYYEGGIVPLLDISSIPTCIIVDKNGNISSRMNGFAPERFVGLLTERINASLKTN